MKSSAALSRAARSFSERIARYLLWPVMQLWCIRLRRMMKDIPRPSDAPRAYGTGLNPDRVLCFGTGAVEGYGVASHQVALPGQLAHLLPRKTGRGVDVDLVIHSESTIASAPRAFAGLAASSYDAIIVSIGVLEAVTLTSPQRWRMSMHDLVKTIQSSTRDGAQVIVSGIQPLSANPAFRSPFATIADAHSVRLNTITEEVCALLGVTFVPLPAPERRDEVRHQTIDGYARWASLFTAVLARQLQNSKQKPVVSNSAVNPQRGERRQRALESLQIHLAEEEQFNRVIQLARGYFDTPFAEFTLIDAEKTGYWARPGALRHKIASDDYYCAIAIDEPSPMIVEDTWADERTRAGSTAGVNIRFYAGHAVESPDGERVGVLCVFGMKPRVFDAADATMLRDLAMMLQLELWNCVSRDRLHV